MQRGHRFASGFVSGCGYANSPFFPQPMETPLSRRRMCETRFCHPCFRGTKCESCWPTLTPAMQRGFFMALIDHATQRICHRLSFELLQKSRPPSAVMTSSIIFNRSPSFSVTLCNHQPTQHGHWSRSVEARGGGKLSSFTFNTLRSANHGRADCSLNPLLEPARSWLKGLHGNPQT